MVLTAGTLTVLLTDLVGSTEQRVRVGEDRARELRGEVELLVQRIVSAHGGEVVKGTGDGSLAGFPGAAAALDAAVAIQAAIVGRNRTASEPIGLRIALAIGDLRVRADDLDGLAVVEAARVCALADGGQILVTEAVRVVIGPRAGYEFVALGPIELRGLPDPVPIYEAIGTALAVAPLADDGPGAPFVGRRDELAFLLGRLAAAEHGRPSVVVVQGAAGLGKSRLAREVARHATRRSFQVCSGHAREQLELPFLALAGDFFGRLAELAREQGVEVPEVIARTAGSSANPVVPFDRVAGDEQTWILHAVVRLTLQLARERPLMLIVDDVHWADAATLDLLTYLVLEVADTATRDAVPFMLVLTARPDDRAVLVRALERMQREDLYASIDLQGFDEHESMALLTGLGLTSPTRQLVGQVWQATEGNPLFLSTVAPRLRESSEAAPTRAGPGTLNVPADLARAVAARLDLLPLRVREVLAFAAQTGDPFEVERTAAAADLDEEIVREAFTCALDEGIVVPRGDRVAFDHPLVAHVLGSVHPPEVQRAAHARVAACLVGTGDSVIERAHHLIAAGDEADRVTLLEVGRAAGEQAWALGGWAEAARMFDAAAEAAQELGRDAEGADLLGRAGASHARNMDPGPGRARFAEAVAAYERLGDPDRAALARMEQVRAELVTAEFGDQVDAEPLELGADALDDDALASCLLATAAQTRWVAGRTEDAIRLADAAVARGESSGESVGTVWGLVARSGVHWLHLHLDDAMLDLEAALRRARRAGDPWLEGLVLPRLALTQLWLGRLDEATESATGACENAEETRDWAEQSLAFAALLGVATARGEWDAAEIWGEHAWTALRLSRYSWTASLVLPALAWARLQRGDPIGADDALDRWAKLGDGGPSLHEPLVEVVRALVRVGREAPKHDDPTVWPRWPPVLGSVQGFAALVELGASGAPNIPLDDATAGLEVATEHGMVFGEGLVVLVDRAAGLAAVQTGRLDEAVARFEAAATVADRIGARPELGRALLDHATAVATTDPRGALGLADRATGVLGDVGMPRYAAEARALARRLRASTDV